LIQSKYPADKCPIRIALVTARAAPAHKRVINTLRKENIRIDETFFLGGLAKGKFLKGFSADIFFDDLAENCLETTSHVSTGHVPYGINNSK
jgi:5'-nucleotidase